MSGDTDNASLWTDADVYVAALGVATPATIDDAFPAHWQLVGLLDGDDGFSEGRSWDKSDKFAWGDILVRTARRNFKLTKKFTALERNAATEELMWPGSTVGTLVVPRPDRIQIGFETREGEIKRRLICAYQAEVDLDGDIDDKEGDLTKYKFIATIYPDSDGNLWTAQHSGTGS